MIIQEYLFNQIKTNLNKKLSNNQFVDDFHDCQRSGRFISEYTFVSLR